MNHRDDTAPAEAPSSAVTLTVTESYGTVVDLTIDGPMDARHLTLAAYEAADAALAQLREVDTA